MLFGGISKVICFVRQLALFFVFNLSQQHKASTVQEQLSNIRESIASARGSKGVGAAPSTQLSRPQNQQNSMGPFIEE